MFNILKTVPEYKNIFRIINNIRKFQNCQYGNATIMRIVMIYIK